MSTEFILHKDGNKEVEIVNGGSRFSLDLYGYSDDGDPGEPCVFGPQQMGAEPTLAMAAKIIYAVWTSYRDEANNMAAALAEDIPRGAGKT